MVKVKYRYFLIEVICQDFGKETIFKLPLNSHNIQYAIHDLILDMLGDYGSAVLSDGFRVKMFNPFSRIAYLRVKREQHLLFASVLPFLSRINHLQCSFRTLHIGGTLRCCHKSLIKFHSQNLPVLLSKCKTDEEKAEVTNSINSCIEKYSAQLSE